MITPILIASTFYILFLVSPTFSLKGPSSNGRYELKEPLTMYDMVAKKCHNLEATNLKENEIFTSKCINWVDINAITVFNRTTKSSVECLVFYEALVSFCTAVGDSLNIPGLIPTTSDIKKMNYPLKTICPEDKNNLYPSNKTENKIEHNLLYSLIQNSTDCLLLCIDYSDAHVSNICKFAYYFVSFNVSKLTQVLKTNTLHHSVNIPEVGSNESSKNISNALNVSANNTEVLHLSHDGNSKKMAILVPVAKPQLTQKDNPNAINHKQKAKVEDTPPKEELGQLETEAKLPKPPSQVQEQGIQNNSLPGGPLSKNNNNAEQEESLFKEPFKPNNYVENSPPKSNQEIGQKPETKKNLQTGGDNDLTGNKSPGTDGDGADQDTFEEGELGSEDDDVKDEHILPVDNTEPKMLKKVKPSTVEDEAASNFSAPEDDMNGDSYFFSYFTVIMCLLIVGYVGYHNRQKVLALILEGKKGKRPGRGRRPNSANYHKLDTNLEEAISSSCTKSVSNVIY